MKELRFNKGSFLLILEGIDGAGKSTFARRLRTITQYQPLIWGEIAERQARRMAAEARVQRTVNAAVERVLLPLVALLSAVVILSIVGELLLAGFHLITR